MESWEINGRTLEYFDESHTYLVDGVIVPSVTQLLSRKFGHKYDNIAPDVLQQAADRGTRIHEAVEKYCKGLPYEDCPELRDFIFLKEYYKFEAVENELPVIVDIGGQTFAGRLDMIISYDDNEMAVADIKTTSTLDKEYLGHQLNLYRIGVEQCYDIVAQRLLGIHLKAGKRKIVEIPVKGESWLVKSLNIQEA